MDFKDKIVLITGASSGIGRETAIQFAKQGANLVLVARRADRMQLLKSELKRYDVSIMICKCDVSQKEQVKKMSETVLEKFGAVDILVNNAGFIIFGMVDKISIDEIESQMRTNYFGMVYCTKNILPAMLNKKSGHIVNIASVGASLGVPGVAGYCASKFAMLGFSESLKHELRDTGVGVTVVSPITVSTAIFDHPSFEKMPIHSPRDVSTKMVAKAILKAANSPRLEIIVPPAVRGVIWIKNTFPYIVNPILGRYFKRQLNSTKQKQQESEPV